MEVDKALAKAAATVATATQLSGCTLVRLVKAVKTRKEIRKAVAKTAAKVIVILRRSYATSGEILEHAQAKTQEPVSPGSKGE